MNEKTTKDNLCKFIQSAEQLSIGHYCKKFEDMFAEWQGRKYCVSVNSGSSANLILIQSLINLGKIKKGDKIGFSSLTWATNVMPLIQLGLNPIPVDVELDTLNISLESFKKQLLEHEIKALFITNLLGRCDDSFDELVRYCNENDILLLEDNCESMGTVFKGKKLGNYGFASTFSTYVGHHMSTIEGGMICTDDVELYDMLLMTRAHGWDRNLSKDRQEIIREKYGIDGFYSKYTFYCLGYNVRPNEIGGFLGCEQLQYLTPLIEIRKDNATLFIEKINNNAEFFPLKYDHIDLFSNFAIPIICKSTEILNKYIKKFEEKGVEIRPIVGGDLTKQIFRKNLYNNGGEKQKNTNAELIHIQGFYFGNSPEYTKEEIDLLLSIISQ